MSKKSFPRRYQFPLEIVDDVRLEKPEINLRNEDLLLDLHDLLVGEGLEDKTVMSATSSEDDLSPENAALAGLRGIVGDEGIVSLEEILAAYTAQKRFFSEVLTKPEGEALQSVGKLAARLVDAIEKVTYPNLELWLDISAAELADLVEKLHILDQAKELEGSLERDFFPFEDKLLEDITYWWNAATDSDPRFWSRGEETHSSFVRYANVVVGLLPEDVRPTDSHGTPGFSRSALKRRYDKSLQDRHRRDKDMELLRRLARNQRSKGPE